jgi:uroporphyrinogen decarboxylase
MNFIRKHPADFSQLEKVLQRCTPERPVLFEYFMNGSLISAITGKSFSQIQNQPEQIKTIIDFFYKTGYDYATIPSRYFCPFAFKTANQNKKETVSLNEGFLITDWKSFDLYIWPKIEEFNSELLELSATNLPDGMKIIVSAPGGLLENAISLIGFENLCFMVYEDETLAKLIFDNIGSRLLAFYQVCSKTSTVGALIVNDDWGFKTQTMLPPDLLRHFVFPWHKKIVETIHRNNKFAILHSCGNLAEVMTDICTSLNYDAKHSFEDEILPVEKAYEKYHNHIAVMGGIDMDFLVRQSPEKINERAHKLLETTKLKGYALGSGNSIPDYVPVENYMAMINAANDY